MKRRIFLATVLTTIALGLLHPSFGQTRQTASRVTNMGTTLYTRNFRTTTAGADDRAFDLGTVSSAGATWYYNFDAVASGGQVRGFFASASAATDNGLSHGFYSDRMAADTTISGTMQITHFDRAYSVMNPLGVTYRWVVSSLTTSGNVETVIGTVDEPAVASGETADVSYTVNVPVSTPVTLAAGQRFIVRLYLIPAPGRTMGTGRVSMRMSSTPAIFSEVKITFAETFTVVPNTTLLYPRRTTAAAIGTFFDLLPTGATQTAATGVTTTTAGGTEIAWTKTAGGAALHWISPRFSSSWNFATPDSTLPAMTGKFTVKESSSAVNATIRVKLFHYRAGVETLIFSNDYNVEISGLSVQQVNLQTIGANYSITPMAFLPDDRLVLRGYVIPAPTLTMGAGTFTVSYDGTPSGSTENSIILFDLPVNPFKAETDPATAPIVPGGRSMLGVSNGQ